MKSAIYQTDHGFKVSVEIVRDTDRDEAKVIVLADFYKEKRYTMPHSYTASQFTDEQILKDSDFLHVMFQRYGN